MAPPNTQPKTMSSRLAGMKFMQRAGASPAPPSTPAEPPSKKQRISNGSVNASPLSTPRSEARTPNEAATPEEQRRTFDPAEDGRDGKWYLSFKEPRPAVKESPLRIVSAGYSTLDAAGAPKERSEEDEPSAARPPMAGRKSFGKFNKALEKQQNPDMSSSDSDSAESEDSKDDRDDDEDDEDDPTGAKALITQARKEAGDKARAERKAKKKAEKADAEKMAQDRRNKHVKLNGLTSISGVSGNGPSVKNVTCHKCGKKGHIQRECPDAGQRGGQRR